MRKFITNKYLAQMIKPEDFKKLQSEMKRLKNSLLPILSFLELETLREFFPKLGILGVGRLGSGNIKNLLDGLDPHLLSEKGLFSFLDGCNSLKVSDSDEQRIVGLIQNGQWLIIKIYPCKIMKMPSRGIELRDCFDVIRIGSSDLSFRDVCDILISLLDIKKLATDFYGQLAQLIDQQERKMEILQQGKKQTGEALNEILKFLENCQNPLYK
jgi:hypothetical protein